jgi:hypothetical protein
VVAVDKDGAVSAASDPRGRGMAIVGGESQRAAH